MNLKRLVVIVAVMAAIAVFTFCATVGYCMTRVKVYEEHGYIVLELCGQEWLHNASDEMEE